MNLEKKRENTERAHQQYSTPLVGVIVLLFQKEKIALFKENNKWNLPEKFAQGSEYLEEAIQRTLSDYVSISQNTVESCTLLSGGDYRKDAYQFNYIALVKSNNIKSHAGHHITWVSPDTLDDMTISANHKPLLTKYFSQGHLTDRTIVPENPATRLQSDLEKLKKTKEIHAHHYPMPLITVDGLLLKFSDDFEGIVLEKRSSRVKREPGKWAFPAGFVNAHERVSEALAYEMYEEINITLEKDNFLSVFTYGSGPHRDPKYFVWTQFLAVYTTEEPRVNSEEIEDVHVFPLNEIPWGNIAFDHGEILRQFVEVIPDYKKRVRMRI